MARQRIKLRGKVYEVPAFDELPIKHALLFDVQAADLGIPDRWTDVEEAAFVAASFDPEVDLYDAAQFARSHAGRLVVAAAVWAAMNIAGEDVTLSEATDIPESEVDFLDPPKDRQPKKRATKKSTRTSAPVAEPAVS